MRVRTCNHLCRSHDIGGVSTDHARRDLRSSAHSPIVMECRLMSLTALTSLHRIPIWAKLDHAAPDGSRSEHGRGGPGGGSRPVRSASITAQMLFLDRRQDPVGVGVCPAPPPESGDQPRKDLPQTDHHGHGQEGPIVSVDHAGSIGAIPSSSSGTSRLSLAHRNYGGFPCLLLSSGSAPWIRGS